MGTTIYCDEAGITGNNLLAKDQPFFVFSSVALPRDHAAEIVEKAIKDFKIDCKELKGKKLCGNNRGRKAICWIIEQAGPHSRLHISDKKFALAAKFFEYMIEPGLVDGDVLFYEIGLNTYVSNILYEHFLTTDDKAEEFFKVFEQLMRSLDVSVLETLLEPVAPSGKASPVNEILTFCVSQKDHIRKEIEGLKSQRRNWVLELSLSALTLLLSTWAEKYDDLEDVCDDSDPLKETVDLFTSWIGAKPRRVSLPVLGTTHFPSLVEPVKFARSEDEPGIQIADVLASALAQAAKRGAADETTAKWGRALFPSIAGNIMPDPSATDMTRAKTWIALAVLRELVRRAVKGQNLYAGMERFVEVAKVKVKNFARKASG